MDDEDSKKQFVALMLKLDIRLKLLKSDQENYYKIWVIRKDVGKRAYYTDYHRDIKDTIPEQPSLQEVLNMLRLLIDVPKSFREYRMQRGLSGLKEDHIRDLEFANRFKGVLDRLDVRALPHFSKNLKNLTQSKNMYGNDDHKDVFLNKVERFEKKMLANKIRRYRKLGYTTIRISAVEYRYLVDLFDDIVHFEKLLKQYGFDEKGNLNLTKCPMPRSDKEVEGIENDILNYDHNIENAMEYIEQLARNYCKDLSPNGVIFYPPRKGSHNKLNTSLIFTFKH